MEEMLGSPLSLNILSYFLATDSFITHNSELLIALIPFPQQKLGFRESFCTGR